MNTFDRKPRHRSNNSFRRRRYSGFSNNSGMNQNHSNSSSNHSGFRANGRFVHNAERLVEKYNILAREALVQGDRIAAENYFQHADHFTRLMPVQGDLNSTNSNGEQTAIINKIPGIHLDHNEEAAAKNTSEEEEEAGHSKESELNK